MRIAHFINSSAIIVTDAEIDISRLQGLIGHVDGTMYFYDKVEMKAFERELVVEGEVYRSGRVMSTHVYPDDNLLGEADNSYPYGIIDSNTGKLMPQVYNTYSLEPPVTVCVNECAGSGGTFEFGYPMSAMQDTPGMLDIYYATSMGVKVVHTRLPFDEKVALVRVGFRAILVCGIDMLIITESGKMWVAKVRSLDKCDEVFSRARLMDRVVDMDSLTGVGMNRELIFLLENNGLEMINVLDGSVYKFQHVVDASPVVFIRRPVVKSA